MIMVTDDRIYRETCTGDLLLVLPEELEHIPASVTEGETDLLALELLSCLCKVVDRVLCKDRELRICLGLDVTDTEDIVVDTVTCLDEIEIKLRASLCEPIVCRNAGTPVSCVA